MNKNHNREKFWMPRFRALNVISSRKIHQYLCPSISDDSRLYNLGKLKESRIQPCQTDFFLISLMASKWVLFKSILRLGNKKKFLNPYSKVLI